MRFEKVTVLVKKVTSSSDSFNMMMGRVQAIEKISRLEFVDCSATLQSGSVQGDVAVVVAGFLFISDVGTISFSGCEHRVSVNSGAKSYLTSTAVVVQKATNVELIELDTCTGMRHDVQAAGNLSKGSDNDYLFGVGQLASGIKQIIVRNCMLDVKTQTGDIARTVALEFQDGLVNTQSVSMLNNHIYFGGISHHDQINVCLLRCEDKKSFSVVQVPGIINSGTVSFVDNSITVSNATVLWKRPIWVQMMRVPLDGVILDRGVEAKRCSVVVEYAACTGLEVGGFNAFAQIGVNLVNFGTTHGQEKSETLSGGLSLLRFEDCVVDLKYAESWMNGAVFVSAGGSFFPMGNLTVIRGRVSLYGVYSFFNFALFYPTFMVAKIPSVEIYDSVVTAGGVGNRGSWVMLTATAVVGPSGVSHESLVFKNNKITWNGASSSSSSSSSASAKRVAADPERFYTFNESAVFVSTHMPLSPGVVEWRHPNTDSIGLFQVIKNELKAVVHDIQLNASIVGFRSNISNNIKQHQHQHVIHDNSLDVELATSEPCAVALLNISGTVPNTHIDLSRNLLTVRNASASSQQQQHQRKTPRVFDVSIVSVTHNSTPAPLNVEASWNTLLFTDGASCASAVGCSYLRIAANAKTQGNFTLAKNAVARSDDNNSPIRMSVVSLQGPDAIDHDQVGSNNVPRRFVTIAQQNAFLTGVECCLEVASLSDSLRNPITSLSDQRKAFFGEPASTKWVFGCNKFPKPVVSDFFSLHQQEQSVAGESVLENTCDPSLTASFSTLTRSDTGDAATETLRGLTASAKMTHSLSFSEQTLTHHVAADPEPPVLSVSQAVVQAATVAAGAADLPGEAMVASRAMVSMSLIRGCPTPVNKETGRSAYLYKPLPFPQNPVPSFRLGDGAGQYLKASLFCHGVLLIAVVLIALYFGQRAADRRAQTERSPRKRAKLSMFSAAPVIDFVGKYLTFTMLNWGTVAGIAFASQETGLITMAIVVTALVIVGVAVVMLYLSFVTSDEMTGQPLVVRSVLYWRSEASTKMQRKVRNFLTSPLGVWLLVGKYAWQTPAKGPRNLDKMNTPPASGILAHMGPFLRKVWGPRLRQTPDSEGFAVIDRERRLLLAPFYLPASFLLSLSVILLQGAALQDPSLCFAARIYSFVISFFIPFATWYIRPYLVPAKNVLTFILDVFSAICGLLALPHVIPDEGSNIDVVVMVLGIVTTVLSLLPMTQLLSRILLVSFFSGKGVEFVSLEASRRHISTLIEALEDVFLVRSPGDGDDERRRKAAGSGGDEMEGAAEMVDFL